MMADSAFADDYRLPSDADHAALRSRSIQVKVSYEAKAPGEMTCSAGMFVEVVRRDVTSGWWLVRFGDRLGRIPSSHLNLTPAPPDRRNQLFRFSGSFSAPNSPNLSVSSSTSSAPRSPQSPRSPHRAAHAATQLSPPRPARSTVLTSEEQRQGPRSVRPTPRPIAPPISDRSVSVPSALCSLGGRQTTRGGAPRLQPLVRQKSEYVAMSPSLLVENSDDLFVYDWFHGMMSRQQAEYLLQTFGVHASFLTRESDNVSGRYAVSIRCGNGVQHFRIYSTKGGYFINQGDPLCANIPALIQRHGQVPIRGLKSKTVFVLCQPLGRSECRFSQDLSAPDGYEDMSQLSVGSPTHEMLAGQISSERR